MAAAPKNHLHTHCLEKLESHIPQIKRNWSVDGIQRAQNWVQWRTLVKMVISFVNHNSLKTSSPSQNLLASENSAPRSYVDEI
jgi:hypothetical protein